MFPTDHETKEEILGLFEHNQEKLSAGRQKLLGIVMQMFECVSILLPLSHNYQPVTIDSELKIQPHHIEVASDLAWADDITETQRKTVERFTDLFITMNGHRTEMGRWMTLANVLERCPEYIDMHALLETNKRNRESGIRILSNQDLLLGASTYSTEYSTPSTHPKGLPRSSEMVMANGLAWRITAVAYAVSGEKTSFREHCDGDGAKVYLGRVVGCEQTLKYMEDYLDVAKARPPLDQTQLKHLRFAGIDAMETTAGPRQALGKTARNTLMKFLRESRTRAHDLMVRNGIQNVPAPDNGFNSTIFSNFQITELQKQDDNADWINGTANLVVFFMQSPFNSSQSFKRTVVLLADATLRPEFFHKSFRDEFCGQPVSLGNLPSWIYPTLIQTLMVQAHTHDNAVQVSDHFLPLNCLSVARALVLMETSPSEKQASWKFEHIADMITSRDKIVVQEEEEASQSQPSLYETVRSGDDDRPEPKAGGRGRSVKKSRSKT
jgi:hypothetical protein